MTDGDEMEEIKEAADEVSSGGDTENQSQPQDSYEQCFSDNGLRRSKR